METNYQIQAAIVSLSNPQVALRVRYINNIKIPHVSNVVHVNMFY